MFPLLLLVAVVAVGIIGYFGIVAKKAGVPAGVACTLEAKQCPDGSFVGHAGPNCEFAECPSIGSTVGILSGKVTIGPICPVERVGVPCPVPSEAYLSREFIAVGTDGKTVASFHADPDGSYNVSLAPGIYVVKSAKTGIGYFSKDLPATVTIVSGQTVTLNINIDTGIR